MKMVVTSAAPKASLDDAAKRLTGFARQPLVGAGRLDSFALSLKLKGHGPTIGA